MPPHFVFAAHCIQGLWLAWALLWTVFSFGNKRSVYRQPLWQRLAYLLLGVVAAIPIYFIPALQLWMLPGWPALEIGGVLLCAAGLGFAVWARFHLGRNWSGIVTFKESHELIQSGPYAVVRHPIYTGILTAFAGTFLALAPSPGGAYCFLIVSVAFAIKMGQEERLMRQKFPEAYAAYKARVRAAIIPFVL